MAVGCGGCIYIIGKEGTCPMVYACSGNKPEVLPTIRKKESKKGRREKDTGA
jgi:hypothetical protein